MSYQVFARKYRPKTFHDLLGQEHVVRTLSNAIAQDRMAHAYLFVGPRGTGKTSTSRIFAKALNCPEGPTTHFDPDSPICREIAEGQSLDVIEIDGASNNSVDDIRNLCENINFRPSQGKFRIYYIDEVHMLSTSAFNALLKTLEEPPAHAKFIFATTEVHKIPATILSRCQRFDLRPISSEIIAGQLLSIASIEHISLSRDAAMAIAKAADGGMRDALSMFDQLVAFCGNSIGENHVLEIFGLTSRDTIARLMAHILDLDAASALQIIASQAELGRDLSQFLIALIEFLREILIARLAGNAAPDNLPEDWRTAIESRLAPVQPRKLLRLMDVLTETETSMRWATNKRIHLELGVIKSIHSLNEVQLSDVIRALDGAPIEERPVITTPAPSPAPLPQTPANSPSPTPPAAPSQASPVSSASTAEPHARPGQLPPQLPETPASLPQSNPAQSNPAQSNPAQATPRTSASLEEKPDNFASGFAANPPSDSLQDFPSITDSPPPSNPAAQIPSPPLPQPVASPAPQTSPVSLFDQQDGFSASNANPFAETPASPAFAADPFGLSPAPDAPSDSLFELTPDPLPAPAQVSAPESAPAPDDSTPSSANIGDDDSWPSTDEDATTPYSGADPDAPDTDDFDDSADLSNSGDLFASDSGVPDDDVPDDFLEALANEDQLLAESDPDSSAQASPQSPDSALEPAAFRSFIKEFSLANPLLGAVVDDAELLESRHGSITLGFPKDEQGLVDSFGNFTQTLADALAARFGQAFSVNCVYREDIVRHIPESAPLAQTLPDAPPTATSAGVSAKTQQAPSSPPSQGGDATSASSEEDALKSEIEAAFYNDALIEKALQEFQGRLIR